MNIEGELGFDPNNLKVPVNLIISSVVGLTVGLVEEVPIEWMPNVLVYSLAVAFALQEWWLVQRTSWPASKKWYGGTGQYEKEAERYEMMLKAKFSSSIVGTRRFAGWGRLAVTISPFVAFFLVGTVLLLTSDRAPDLLAFVRIMCVSVILALGLEPIMGTLTQKPIATVGALVVYGMAVYLGLTGYPGLALDLHSRIGSFSALAFSSGALSYLLLSTRWAYYRAFCYDELDNWVDFCTRTGVPLMFILYPQIPKFLEAASRIYVGA